MDVQADRFRPSEMPAALSSQASMVVPPRFEALTLLPHNIPDELKERRQWVNWTDEWDGSKWKKPPLRPTSGRRANHSNFGRWGTYAEACAFAENQSVDGMGFVLTTEDPYVAIDLDHCRDLKNGALTPEAQRIVDTLDSYTEVSPSGTGVPVIVRGPLPVNGRRSNGVELYAVGHYVTMTGQHLPSTPTSVEQRSGPLNDLYDRLSRETESSPRGSESKPAVTLPGRGTSTIPTTGDEEVVRPAREHYGDRFDRLFASGDLSRYDQSQFRSSEPASRVSQP